MSQQRGRQEWAYFSNVDKSAHQILVTEGVHGLLGLLPCCVFHNPKNDQLRTAEKAKLVTDPHPYITRGQCPNPSIQRPTTKINQERPAIYV